MLAAATGHVAAHEAGAIEYTGHKVIGLPQKNGKLDAAELRALVATFYADDNHDHMVFPGMVYISHPTEGGTLYTKAELTALRHCRRSGPDWCPSEPEEPGDVRLRCNRCGSCT